MAGKVISAASLIPPALAVTFILTYAVATPVTDEWVLTYNAMILHGQAQPSPGFFSALADMRWHVTAHPLIVPTFIYLLLGPLVHFDSRVFMFLNLACNALILACAYSRGLRGAALLAGSVIVFSPARYMEILWGFQFAFGLSVLMGVVGLTLIDAAPGQRNPQRTLLAGYAAIIFGLLCSIISNFALPAVLVIRLMQGNHVRELKLFTLAMIACCAACFIFLGAKETLRLALFVLTAIGSVFFSSPSGLTNFAVDIRSVAGFAVLAFDALLVLRAVRRGFLRQLTYGIALIIYGGLTLLTIGLFRDYLGNWHLQCALPLVIGSLLLVSESLKAEGRSFSLRELAIVAAAATVGYWNAFSHYGADYSAYVQGVRSYMLSLMQNRQMAKPYPEPPELDVTRDLVLFLKSAGNPDFIEGPGRTALVPPQD